MNNRNKFGSVVGNTSLGINLYNVAVNTATPKGKRATIHSPTSRRKHAPVLCYGQTYIEISLTSITFRRHKHWFSISVLLKLMIFSYVMTISPKRSISFYYEQALTCSITFCNHRSSVTLPLTSQLSRCLHLVLFKASQLTR